MMNFLNIIFIIMLLEDFLLLPSVVFLLQSCECRKFFSRNTRMLEERPSSLVSKTTPVCQGNCLHS